MSNGIIVRPWPLTSAMVTAFAVNGIDSAFPVANLIDVQPKVILRTAPSLFTHTWLRILIDFGEARAFDTVALLFTNVPAGAQWQIWAPVSPTDEPTEATELYAGPFGVTADVPGRRHGLATFAGVTRRYLTIYTEHYLGPGLFFDAGVVIVGRRLPLSCNFELGDGRALEDGSVIRTLPGGESYAELAVPVPRWRATWSGLTEADYRAMWAMLCEVGTGRPILAVEDPDAVTGQAEGIHYGRIETIDFSERVQLDKRRLELRIKEML